ncbi:hypothetical protein HF1_02830 [Mycoplasma haemofelis str. Langford 1]|uniref:Uncharacterized protein n=1 Tax=Mycoplasma haemofelis (strain Langford 1) TaxID=941640 RepID=E8ZGM0_MYCHL|nr:hypothetical protein [Mycoplasma haemofelis]CBY92291.1 hypothetical protein HF1_02830 [Mycoplasma haemofelis str. Langford 1]
MSVSLSSKLALGSLAGGSAIGGGILVGSKYLGEDSKKSVLSALLKEKNPEKRFISKDDSSSGAFWKAAWKNYLTSSSNSWSLNIEGVKKDGTDTPPSSFVDKCVEKSGELVENEKDPLYSQVLSYCTRDTLIKDLVTENASKRFLDVASGKDTSQWKTSWDSYKSKNENKTTRKDKWNLTDWQEKQGQNDVPESFKSKCTEKSSINAYSGSSLVEDYGFVLDWCTTNA